MAASNYLERAGIVGWEKLEGPILAAIAAEQSLLFIGSHGSNKTEGAETIARAVIGKDCIFRKYDTPMLNMEDVLGFPDPSSIKDGELRFIQTSLSIWTPDACLLDEINRASMFLASKLMEVIRAKTIMGMKTNLQLVLSAVNPPSTYQSGYMDLALASRFTSFQIPDAQTMSDAQIDDILINGNEKRGEVDPFEIKSAIEQARITKFSKSDIEYAATVVRRLTSELNKNKVRWSMRQARGCLAMILKLEAFKATGLFSPDIEDFVTLILSTIPEVHGITRSVAEKASIEGTVRSLMVGFELKDPAIVAKSLEELIAAEVRDQLAWASAVKSAIAAESSTPKVLDAVKEIKKRASSGSLDLDIATNVVKNLQVRRTYLETAKLAEEFSLEALDAHFDKLREEKAA